MTISRLLNGRIMEQLESIQHQLATHVELINVLKETIRLDAIGAADSLAEHIADLQAHTSDHERQMRSEWRDAVTERLARIEALILQIRKGA